MAEIGNVTFRVDAVITDEQYHEAMSAVSAANEYIAALEAENAKLRELVRDYLIFYSQPGCTYCFCHDECRESEEPCMAFERLVDRTNELGIEVPR